MPRHSLVSAGARSLVGPSGEDDFACVFGDADVPLKTFGAQAGPDVSPAVWHRPGMTDNALTEWRFV